MLPPRDKEGFLKSLDDWNEDVADALAQAEGIDLTPEHWEIIHVARDFHREFALSPAMRILVRRVRDTVGAEKGRSIHLLRLFPDRPARKISKIAGLPKPTNCD
tara:strand:- start:1478 stop:1789 length:312 start_codon:yes stop_codon:yes gene_type:complete